MYYFIYKTINQLTQEYYIGKHCTENLNDGYIGSGKKFLEKVHKYGKQNFYRTILEFFNSYEELNEAEKKYVTEELLNDVLCMNNQTGGDDGFIQSVEVIEKIRLKNTGKICSEETKEKISKANKGRVVSEETKEKMKLARLYRSEEQELERRKKLSEAMKGRTSNRKGVKLSEETKKKMSESLKGITPWNKGKKWSEEAKEKMRHPKKKHQ